MPPFPIPKAGSPLAFGLACSISLTTAAAQEAGSGAGTSSTITVYAANAAIGALTAASRALLKRERAPTAFLVGAVGGAVNTAGKSLGPRSGSAVGLIGVGLSALGSSIVANAGEGKGGLSDLYLPFGPVRFRVTTDSSRRVFATLNLFEFAVLVHYATQGKVGLDVPRSLSVSTFVFTGRRRPIVSGVDRDADGVTSGSVIVMSKSASDLDATFVHEMIHVEQQWFMAENWSRPVETAARRRIHWLHWIPSWVDVGVVAPSFLILERRAFGSERGPLRRALEWEAESFERRR